MARSKISPWGFVGMGAMACVLFLFLGTAGIAPWWVTTLFVVMWLLLFVVATRWFVPHPKRLPWLAVIAFLVWFATIVIGTGQYGWR